MLKENSNKKICTYSITEETLTKLDKAWKSNLILNKSDFINFVANKALERMLQESKDQTEVSLDGIIESYSKHKQEEESALGLLTPEQKLKLIIEDLYFTMPKKEFVKYCLDRGYSEDAINAALKEFKRK